MMRTIHPNDITAEGGGTGSIYAGPAMVAEGVSANVASAASNQFARTADLYVAANGVRLG